jgi:hypothetical protein
MSFPVPVPYPFASSAVEKPVLGICFSTALETNGVVQ